MHVGGGLVGAGGLNGTYDAVVRVHYYAVAVAPAEVLDALVEAEVGVAVVCADAGGVGGSGAVGAEGGVD